MEKKERFLQKKADGRSGEHLPDEKFERVLQQFKEDSKSYDFSDSVMDRIFEQALEDVRSKKALKATKKIVGIAASIAILFGVTNHCTQTVYGESLIQIVKNSIKAGKFTITAINKNDDSQFEGYEDELLSYEADSIEAIFETVIKDGINNLFYISNLPERYNQWNAKYNKEFQRLTINSQREDEYLYICEELDYENVVSGTIIESNIVSTVFNKNLQFNIDIIKQMDNTKCSGYYIELFCDGKRLRVEGDCSVEEFEMIAKNIFMW